MENEAGFGTMDFSCHLSVSSSICEQSACHAAPSLAWHDKRIGKGITEGTYFEHV